MDLPPFPRRVFGLAFLLITVAGVGCSKVDNPGYCCIDNDCDAHGGAHGCPMPEQCDQTKYTCIDPTQGGPCTTSDECNTVAPYCDPTQHVCKGCLESMNCPASAPECSSEGACTASCASDNDCGRFTSTQLGHCETAGANAGECVQCRTGGTDCPTNAPVCDQNACRPCNAGTDCASGACDLATGSCVAETDAIYMSPTGSGSLCTKAQPCATFQTALALVLGSRRTISMAAGSYNERVSINNLAVTIIGEGADLSEATSGQIIDITGGATVKIEALRIHDGLGSGGDAVRCTDNGGSPKVTLYGVKLDGNGGRGINGLNNCTVDVEASVLLRNTGTGIVVTMGALDLERSVVQHNTGGGVLVSGSTFTIQNNFVSVNGGVGSTVGGITIQSPSGTGSNVLAFNSVTGNGGAAAVTPGVDCVSVSTPLTFSNNIVYGNTGGTGKQVGTANCSWTYSDLGDGTTGTGNTNADPMFTNVSQDDLHLLGGSPAKDTADPAATLNIDIDGDARPQPTGGRRDMGADEIK